MEMYANLHTHSTHSDGQYTPEELVQVAKAEGYQALAITDHDTATAYPHLKAACDAAGLECIFGVEFTARSPLLTRGFFHMTAYHFDPEHPAMKDYLWQLSENESYQTRALFRRGVEEGLLSGITWQEVLDYNGDITWLCNNHLFRAMKAKGLVTDKDYQPFFNTLFGPRRGEVKLPYEFMQADALIDLVHRAGGIIFVAHPHGQLPLLDDLLAMGLDGLEVWHPELSKTEQQEAYRLGWEKGLYISGGSDHSGLCGGMYATCEKPEESRFFIPPLSVGTTRHHFDEIKNRRLMR